MMRPINKIIIQIVTIKDSESLIDKHVNENGMPEVGFHYMIEPNGSIIMGRSISSIGNHYMADNSSSIGIALIGEKLTKEHELSIDTLLNDLSIKNTDTKNVLIVENGKLIKYKDYGKN